MRILITGSSGLVGSNLLELAPKDVEIFCPKSSELNLLHTDSVEQYFLKIKPDIVIHAAGRVGGIQANIKNHYIFLNENLLIGQNVINSSIVSGCNKLLNLSSSCVYPVGISNNLTVHDILKGPLEQTNEGYALAKIAVQKLVSFARDKYSLNYSTVIPCNLYGRYDSFSPSKSHLVPAIIKKVSDAIKYSSTSIEIWGSGNARREFMYASDFAKFVWFWALNDKKYPAIFNLGMECDFTIKFYYDTVQKIFNVNLPYNYLLNMPEGVFQKKVDISYQRSINWMPPTSLEDGIRSTIKFYLDELQFSH